GTMRYIRYPGHLSDTPACLHRHAPRLGEHSEEVLAELGLSEEDIARLVDEGIVGKM
ncbi:MAG: CoA transferase, partial [Halioglobus sp.]|nr:CoA transferase [Halioglobus sp.]